MALDSEQDRVMDLHRSQIQGYLKAVEAALYSLEEDCERLKGLPKTHVRIGDLIAQVNHAMAECDNEFLEHPR